MRNCICLGSPIKEKESKVCQEKTSLSFISLWWSHSSFWDDLHLPDVLWPVWLLCSGSGDRLQVMNAPPIFQNLHINPNRLSHRDYYVCVCPCLRVFFLPACMQGYESFHVCICWLDLGYLPMQEWRTSGKPSSLWGEWCEAADRCQAPSHSSFGTKKKSESSLKHYNTVRCGIFEMKMCCITSASALSASLCCVKRASNRKAVSGGNFLHLFPLNWSLAGCTHTLATLASLA